MLGFTQKPFSYQNDWHSAECSVTTYELEELLGTKLRALYQRKKGRDFFDLGLCLEQFKLDTDKILQSFKKYIEATDNTVSKAEFEKNLFQKLTDQKYLYDIITLLPKDMEYAKKINPYKKLLYDNIVSKIPGKPWKGDFARCLEDSSN